MQKSLSPGFWPPIIYMQTRQAKNVDCCSSSTFHGPFRRWIMFPSQEQQLLFQPVNRKWSSNISICHPRMHGAFSKSSLSENSQLWTFFFFLWSELFISFFILAAPLYTTRVFLEVSYKLQPKLYCQCCVFPHWASSIEKTVVSTQLSVIWQKCDWGSLEKTINEPVWCRWMLMYMCWLWQ